MQKKIIVYFAILIASLSATNLYAYAKYAQYAYAGIDVLSTELQLPQRYGNEVFGKKKPISYSVFAGHDLPYDFFLEIGYQLYNINNITDLNGDDYVPGEPLPLGARLGIALPYSFNARIKQKLPYLGVGWKYYLFNEDTFVSAFGGFAIANIKSWFEVTRDGLTTYTAAQIDNSRETFSKTKALPLARIALNHVFENDLGVRLIGTVHKLDRLQIRSEARSAEIRFKNSFSIGLGLFYGV